MSTTIAKWGNALGMRIPSFIVKKANLHSGDSVELQLLKTGEILIKPVTKKIKLNDLLKGITKKNCHHEIDWGQEEGNEI